MQKMEKHKKEEKETESDKNLYQNDNSSQIKIL